MPATVIKKYSGESFRDNYVQPEGTANTLFKDDFTKFFIVRLEEMTRLMKLPVPPVRINNHILVYLTAGKASMNIGYETYRIGKDECILVPAGQVFSFDRVESNQGFICNFHPDFIIGKFGTAELLNGFNFLRVWGNPRISLDRKTSAFVDHLLNRILLDYSTYGLMNPDISQSYFIALLCELNGVHLPTLASPQTNALILTNRFKKLLISNIKASHLVTDYASQLAITPNHLNKCVKAVTGKSPTKWIDEAIVLEAKVLLHQTSLTISEVAAEVGIADSSYFSRLFKKYEGRTPLKFRNLVEKAQSLA